MLIGLLDAVGGGRLESAHLHLGGPQSLILFTTQHNILNLLHPVTIFLPILNSSNLDLAIIPIIFVTIR